MAGDHNGKVPTDKMSEVVGQMEREHGPVLIGLWVHADGTIRWRTPKTGDPQTDEILARGWLDKLREVVLATPPKSPLAL
ncbi:MAG: hypothetical protein L0214_07545 [candidate division NC10 bacterium]|nr:hypothetical protein [candidate division NC10 bacterium]